MGAVLGPLLAFIAFPLIGFRGVFWLSFAPAAVSLLILVFFVKESMGLAKQRHMFENATMVLNHRFILLLAVLGFFAVGAYNYSFILLKASVLGVPQAQIPIVYATLNLATVVVGIPSGILADRIGKAPVLCLSYAAFLATSVAGIFLVGSMWYAYPIAFLFGMYFGISDTVQRAIIPDYTKEELKGTAYAFYYVLIGVGALAANSIFGVLWTNVSFSAAFEYSIVTCVVGAAALLIFLAISRRWATYNT